MQTTCNKLIHMLVMPHDLINARTINEAFFNGIIPFFLFLSLVDFFKIQTFRRVMQISIMEQL